MSIKKVTNPSEFAQVWRDLDILFAQDNEKYGHQLHKISAETVIKCWGHASLLAHSMHVWASFEDGKANGVIMFIDHVNTICGERVWNEFFWISNEPKTSFSLLNKALDFARSKNISTIYMHCVEKHPKSSKLKRVYKKLGFLKDSETYSKKL